MSVTFAILHTENWNIDSTYRFNFSETAQNQCPHPILYFKWQNYCGMDHMEQLQITADCVFLGWEGWKESVQNSI